MNFDTLYCMWAYVLNSKSVYFPTAAVWKSNLSFVSKSNGYTLAFIGYVLSFVSD
jgi:hypothetical protein